MEGERSGKSDTLATLFALSRADGRWAIRKGTATFVEGFLHKIGVAGIEVRSGETDVGITATFHVVTGDSSTRPPTPVISRQVYVGGRRVGAEVVAQSVEPV